MIEGKSQRKEQMDPTEALRPEEEANWVSIGDKHVTSVELYGKNIYQS